MSAFIRLSENWTLDDGITEPVSLSEVETVDKALVEAGIVKSAYNGTERINVEWTHRRKWRYCVRFDAPENDERLTLETQGIHGTAEISVNATFVGTVDKEHPDLEISSAAVDGENLLEFTFAPSGIDERNPLPKIGLETAPRIIPSNYLSQTRFTVDREAKNAVFTALYHISGRYEAVIGYSSEDGEGFETQPIPYEVRTGMRKNEFALEADLIGNCDAIRLLIRRNGVICCTCDERLTKPKGNGKYGIAAGKLETARICLKTGADALDAPGWIKKRFPQMSKANGEKIFPGNAFTNEKAFDSAGYGDFDKDPAWRLSGVKEKILRDLSDAERFDVHRSIAETRFRQALDLRETAEKKRIAGEKVCVVCADPDEEIYSASLFDGCDMPRPAFYALRQAWQTLHVCMMPKERTVKENVQTAVPVYLLCDDGRFEVCSVDVAAYTLDGRMISGASYPARTDTCMKVCDFVFQTPTGPQMILLRATAKSGGNTVDTWDGILCVGTEKYDIPKAKIRFVNDRAENLSVNAAVGVSANGFQTVLPGESLLLNGASSLEGLNIESQTI